MSENRKHERKDFAYYMKVMDERSMKVLGHMDDISSIGFKIDTDHEIPIGKEYRVRLDITPDISSRAFIAFTVVCRWCKQDEYDTRAYNVGFEVVKISPLDDQVFQKLVEKYTRR